MNSHELKAEFRNKLQTLRTTIEALKREKDIPQNMIDLSMKDLDSLEKLVDDMKE